MAKQGDEGAKEAAQEAAIKAVPDALSDSAGFLLNRAARLIRERVVRVLEPFGLSARDFGLLRILEGHAPLSQHVLGAMHGVDRTTTVQVIDALEARGLVQRVQNENDRRSYLLYLTPRGKKTLSRALKHVNKVQAEFLQAIAPEEWQVLKSALVKLVSHNL